MSSRITIPKHILEDGKEEILKWLKEAPNGTYTFSVCLGCGGYYVHPETPEDVEIEFTKECKNCFIPEKG